ncbi:hypothetical protein O6H91_22G015600 [Diphasiastrum complanatum]|uniref:Uncharacterized protein n=1 Tax=Diphasiastrum complanatum TaxID=34168 RepID=A0ACC2ADH2_DIPCM|nr:hypothetical protein O6H91_22G015600 [Diphasiastrum complanatum]
MTLQLSAENLSVPLIGSIIFCFVKVPRKANNVMQADKNSSQHSFPLEGAFIWLGGWRPTSRCFGACLLCFGCQGKPFSPAALQTLTSELSDEHLSTMINLQNHTQKAEQELSSKFAMFQICFSLLSLRI